MIKKKETGKTKRFKKIASLVTEESYTLDEALQLLEKYSKEASAKFDETVDAVFKLSIDPKKSDQNVRGSIVMPNGLGKKFKIAVFTSSENFSEARDAGAEIVGNEELIDQIKTGQEQINFEICIATPDMMPKLAAIGKILGPKGLMPNPKLGTVTSDIAKTVTESVKGKAEYKSDAGALVHAGVGKLSFGEKALKENLQALYAALVAAKPSASKGVYMKKAYLSTSQGPSLQIALSSFQAI
jgi:large subunit ribosomal protein L1